MADDGACPSDRRCLQAPEKSTGSHAQPPEKQLLRQSQASCWPARVRWTLFDNIGRICKNTSLDAPIVWCSAAIWVAAATVPWQPIREKKLWDTGCWIDAKSELRFRTGQCCGRSRCLPCSG